MATFSDVAYPTRIVRLDWTIPFLGNDTVRWVGEATAMVDANGACWQGDFAFSTPWYHCATCLDAGLSSWKTRLSIGAKFCSECGTALDWDHLARDPDAEAAVQGEFDALVASARTTATQSSPISSSNGSSCCLDGGET